MSPSSFAELWRRRSGNWLGLTPHSLPTCIATLVARQKREARKLRQAAAVLCRLPKQLYANIYGKRDSGDSRFKFAVRSVAAGAITPVCFKKISEAILLIEESIS